MKSHVFDVSTDTPLEAANFLSEQGYLVIRGGIPEAAIKQVERQIRHLIDQNKQLFDSIREADGRIPRLLNLHAAIPSLIDLFDCNVFSKQVQSEFLGEESTIYTSLYYEHGSAQSLHRDTPVFATRPTNKYLGVWIALEDADERNGCLEVVPKAHLLPEFDLANLAKEIYTDLNKIEPESQALWDLYQSRANAQFSKAGLQSKLIHAKRGDTVIWHPHMPHGGSAIADMTRTRNSFVMHVMPKNTAVYHEDIFFNPNKSAPEKKRLTYQTKGTTQYMYRSKVGLGHTRKISASQLLSQQKYSGTRIAHLFKDVVQQVIQRIPI